MNYENFNDADLIQTVIHKRFRGNTKFYKEMVNLFFETIHDKLETIQQAIPCKDKEKIKFSAHFIKGGASNLGAEAIRQISEQMEYMNPNEIPVLSEKLLHDLNTEIRKFSEFIGRMN